MDPLMSPSFNTCSDAHLVTDIGPFHIDVEMASLLSDMSEEDLRSFAETQEDPISDEQIELYIFSCFFIFQKTCSVEYLERATQRAEEFNTLKNKLLMRSYLSGQGLVEIPQMTIWMTIWTATSWH
ncbi:Vegetative incompatibility protein HET-E-1 [Fusarium oxysporum f. sp. albedinis]|nr:Vegetative incompatibility protein HET-E-1 [Fusarium oxysporum f. sp. albedinis]